MSHFTVTIKVSAERLNRHDGDINAALDEMLEPYEEQTEDKRFLEFQDEEDEYKESYETESTTKIRLPSGELLNPWDERFRGPGIFDGHKVPPNLEKIEVPFKELYKTFGEFCKEWHGSEIDPEKQRHGYWRNPNAKWDWWSIGGRWTGFYPLKPGLDPKLGEPGAFDNKPKKGNGDVIRVSDIDMDEVARQTRVKAEECFEAYAQLLEGKKFKAFEGPRDMMFKLGLMRLEEKPPQEWTNDERVIIDLGAEVVMSWRQYGMDKDDKRSSWFDVAKKIERDDFLKQYIDCFNPIATYAALDDGGWHAPGKMGWWGCSSDKSEDYVEFKKTFIQKFIKNCKPGDTLVVCDCHI